MDEKLVKAAGIRFKSILTGKLRRYFSLRNFIDPIFVLAGFFQSLWIIARFRPDAVFAKGGFVCLPVACAAFILRRPIVLHESDSIMGLSNRIISRMAKKVCTSFPDVIGCPENGKIVFTGNPVRPSILNGSAEKGYALTGFRPERPVVLAWGGSQGSQQINDLIVNSFHKVKSKFQFIHITGSGKHTQISDSEYKQFEYVDADLKHIYAITDIIIGRSGANSLYEIALMQKPNILIPLKSSAHDHQRLNAEYFEKSGASIILRNESLADMLVALLNNSKKMNDMKEALGRIAKPDAAKQIAELLLKI